MLDLEKYTVRNGLKLTPQLLNDRFYAIVRRLHELETLKIDWETAVSTLQNLGLTKINEYIQPLIDTANARIEAIDTEARQLVTVAEEWAGVAEEWAGQARSSAEAAIEPHNADETAHPAIRATVGRVAGDLSGHAADGDLHQDAAGQIALHNATSGAHAAAITQHNSGTGVHSAAITAQRPWATAGEATAGTATNSVMSPARVAEAIAALTPAPNVVGQINARFDDIMIVTDQRPAGESGGTFSSGAWRTRTLNAVWFNEIAGAELISNHIRLPAGGYELTWIALVGAVQANQTRIYNATTGGVMLYGTLGGSSSGNTPALGHGILGIAATCDLRLEHICSHTAPNSGFGYYSDLNGLNLFAEIFIRKIG